jgi:hypothetical protein
LQATGSVPVTFAVPFCTRPDPGEDDYFLVIGPSFASWHTPSCLGRRMADTAAFCVDYLFPRVPTRQYVLSLPYALRFKMAYSADATSVVLGAFISAINSDLRRRARKRKLRGRLQTGSLTVVQRFGSSLNLNVHLHVIAMNGVYEQQPDGSLLFHPLPAPSDEDIARLARSVYRKVTRYLGQLTGEDKDQQLTLFYQTFCGCNLVKTKWRLFLLCSRNPSLPMVTPRGHRR